MGLGDEKVNVYRLSIGYRVKEDSASFGSEDPDFDSDFDPDFDEDGSSG